MHNQTDAKTRATDDNAELPFPYGPVEFSKPERMKPFTKFGKTGIVAANFRVPLLGIPGMAIESAIFGSLREVDGAREVSFEASLPGRVLKCTGDNADIVRDEFLAHVHAAALKWTGYDSAIESAYAAVTGAKMQTVAGAKARPNIPLLVRKPSDERPANMPASPEIESPVIGKGNKGR